MENQMNPDRPKLHLKKLMPVPTATVEPVPIKNSIKAPKTKSEKEQIRLENIRLNAEAFNRRKAQIEKAKPFVNAYFADKSIFQKTVLIDGIECLRPLMIGTRRTIFILFRMNSDLQEYTGTVLNDLISEALKAHVEKPQYIAGLVKFNNRFDLDENLVDSISEKHKKMAIKKQRAK